MKQLIVSLSLLLIVVVGCKKDKEEVTKLQAVVVESELQDAEEIFQFQ